MQKKTKRAVRAAFSVLAASACLAAVCGGLSRKALLEWSGRLAMLSVGIRSADRAVGTRTGGRGKQHNASHERNQAFRDDHAADHPADRMGKRHSVADPSHVSRAGHP